jgi:hypothetical protein
MSEPRLEQIFREETRRALGADRVTVERLIETIADFVTAATPEETAVLARFLRGLASVVAAQASVTQPTPLETAKSAVSAAMAATEAFRKEKAAHVAPGSPTAAVAPTTPPPADAPQPAPRVPAVRPFRVTYPPSDSRPRVVAPPKLTTAPGHALQTDDIEDFTTATGS